MNYVDPGDMYDIVQASTMLISLKAGGIINNVFKPQNHIKPKNLRKGWHYAKCVLMFDFKAKPCIIISYVAYEERNTKFLQWCIEQKKEILENAIPGIKVSLSFIKPIGIVQRKNITKLKRMLNKSANNECTALLTKIKDCTAA